MESNFIKTFIEEDLKNNKYKEIVTRFPPEPNGFLHIGHARAIITNFELAADFNGYTNLRYDDTNPSKEDLVYVEAIKNDIKWLGYEPKNVYFASDYFNEMYERAVLLIKKGKAYVDSQTAEEISASRGNLTTVGTNSIYRERSKEENLKLFEIMKNGLCDEKTYVLRAKIDMSSPNMNLRDPVIYRIVKESHHRTKDAWVIYPMYDFAHPIEDAIEGISHSLCSLEFEDHRPLYDWVIRECEMPNTPRQIEFGRLSIENTIMSKRYLRELVESKKVSGWDDPRMPTLSGLRRRGFTPTSIKNFILSVGLSKINSTMSLEMLESALREDLVLKTKRVMAVVNPLKVTITNYTKKTLEKYEVPYNADNLELGTKKISFGKELYIEKEDFSIIKTDNKFKRLYLGGEVRLLGIGYFIKCNEVVYNSENEIVELLCTYDKNTKSGSNFSQRKPNGTISYVCKSDSANASFYMYESLIDNDIQSDNILDKFNENSCVVKEGYVEKNVSKSKEEDKYQIIRNGYYVVDKNSTKDNLIFNKIVSLKSSYK
ncbi:MAG: glutamine--tRNA ligase/YqeY domain fusion protein [Acholeplasmatales bacterium]|jgi:glutaminyl-tRNA synthetase|nr:glutamine--tRNA ligase/YqeY domain fusion protein [Acholeplasmatales bacterium]